MDRKVISSPAAPAAIGPYSQAVAVPLPGVTMLFCSGQIGLDPSTGQMVAGDVADQTRRVLDNIGAVLAEAGASFADVVKTTIFLDDLGDFGEVNRVYGERFSGPPPARSTVEVARLPKDAKVEIEVIAIVRS